MKLKSFDFKYFFPEAEESEQKLSSLSEPFLNQLNATQVLDQPIFDTVPLDHNDICILEVSCSHDVLVLTLLCLKLRGKAVI